MKRSSALWFLVLACGPLAQAQISSTFTWNGTSTDVVPPVIDATNFVNLGVFNVNVPLDGVSGDALYFTTSDTLNYTNTGTINAVPGLNLGFFPTYYIPPKPGVPFNKMAASFVNEPNGASGGIINCSSSSSLAGGLLFFALGGNTEFLLSATNISNSGVINLDNSTSQILFFFGGTGGAVSGGISPALINLTGENVDLSRGTLSFASSGSFTNSTFGISSQDSGVGTDTNADWDPSLNLLQNSAFSSFFSTRLVPAPFVQTLDLFNSTPYAPDLTGVPVGTNTIIWRATFLQDTSPGSVSHNVYFDRGFAGSGGFHVEWLAPFTDPLTKLQVTNYLYLSSAPVLLTATSVTNAFFTLNGVPQNYTFAESTTELLNPANAASTGLIPIVPGIVTNFYSYLSLQLVPSLSTTNSIYGGNFTNLPERIQISATRSLNLADAQISGPDYLLLRCTNQFEGNAGVSLDAPFSDMSLGVTNGFLTITNLQRPLLPRWSGAIQAFTARWLEPVGGITNDYRVLLVNSQVFPTTVPVVQDLTLHSTNLTISDSLNVLRNLSIDATTLTITTNGLAAFSFYGGLNFLSDKIVWSASLPNLKYLTNAGAITALNLMNFAGNMTSPYSDPNAATPYQSFVNYGTVTNQGSFIVANYFLNSGVFQNATNGNLTLRAKTVYLTNGLFSAPTGAGNVSVTCNSLTVSNHAILAGGALTLSPTNLLTDGFNLPNQFGQIYNPNTIATNLPAYGNTWSVGGSFNLLSNPLNGDLLGTTVFNTAPAGTHPNVLTTSRWAGRDRGASLAGYSNNAALGRLVLDGGANGAFTFTPVNCSNALYVDSLQLTNAATNTDNAFNLLNVTIAPGMKIYYAQALVNGINFAEKLNGKNLGRFYWISNYAGFFSSTNLNYSGTQYVFNKALKDSCLIPSQNHPTLANCADANPFPTTPVAFPSYVDVAPCGVGGGSSGGTGGSIGGGGIGGGTLVSLTPPLPVEPDSASLSNSFARAAGSYNGLFYDTNGVAIASAGSFTASTYANRSFNAIIKLAGGTYLLNAGFDTNGHYAKTNAILRPGKSPLSLNLRLDLDGDGLITGSVSATNWSAELYADHTGFTAAAPTPAKGAYTLVVPGTPGGTNLPAGDGFGAMTVNPGGSVSWSLNLADGTVVPLQMTALSKAGYCPLFYSYPAGTGVLIGWLQLTNQPDVELNWRAAWIKAPVTGAQYYRSGFGTAVTVQGAHYASTVPLLPYTNGVVIFNDGNLKAPLTNKVLVGATGRGVDPASKKQILLITPNNGLFLGSLPGKVTAFSGALLKGGGAGSGYFLGTNQSGQVYFGPAP